MMANHKVAQMLRALYKVTHEKYGCSIVKLQITEDTPDGQAELQFTMPVQRKVYCYLVEDYEWVNEKDVIEFLAKSIDEKVRNEETD